MATAKQSEKRQTDDRAVFSRVVDAPRTLVFQMWTQARHVARWWQPGGFKPVTVEAMDARVGGSFRIKMPHESGAEYVSRGTYMEVREPEKIVYHEFCDENGKVFHEAVIGVTLDDEGGKTRVTIEAAFKWLPDRDARWTPELMRKGWADGWCDNMALMEKQAQGMAPGKAGWSGSSAVEKVQKVVEGNDLTFIRVFDAPRELVFKAWTEARHLAKWWGPHRFTNPVCTADARVGGAYRITMRGPDGTDYPMHGVFLEVEPPERLVMTDIVDEHPEAWMKAYDAYRNAKEGEGSGLNGLIIVTFEEHAGNKTRVTVVNRFKTAPDRDAVIKMGAIEGWAQSFEKLDGVFAGA